MQVPLISGLTSLAAGTPGRLQGSRFALPPGFDSKAFASKWVEAGPGVVEAGQPQILAFANCQADGWAVYKVVDPKGKQIETEPELLVEGAAESAKTEEKAPKKARPVMVPFTRVVGKVQYVLMYRPKQLQTAVNQLFANQSRELVGKEVMGESAAANTSGDPGILTNEDLKRFGKNFSDEMPEGYLKPSNPSAPRPADAVELKLA